MKRINKRQARKMFEQNKEFVIVGDNVNEYHILGGWHLGCHINPAKEKEYYDMVGRHDTAFDDVVAAFEFYLERELGRRAAYYVV